MLGHRCTFPTHIIQSSTAMDIYGALPVQDGRIDHFQITHGSVEEGPAASRSDWAWEPLMFPADRPIDLG